MGSWYNGRRVKQELLRIEAIAADLHAGARSEEGLAHLEALGPKTFTPADLFVEILTLYRKALDMSRQLGDRAAEAEVLYNLGRLYQDPPRESLFLQGKMTDAEFLTAFDTRIGAVHHNTSEDQRQALSYYHQALRLAREENRVIIEASCLVNIAVAHRHLGEWAQHLQYVEEAEPVVDRVGNPMCRLMREALADEKRFHAEGRGS
ncbi:MAG TPA: hypothetical protein VKG65_02885 [Terriglobales bacterium]|nr:hypothetical protein [Terriglobales bacterium]